MDILSINSFIFFVKQAICVKSQMENDYLTDDFDLVTEKKKRFDVLIKRAYSERKQAFN